MSEIGIKDNVDLQQLEKIGFRKQYNRDTGILETYIYDEDRITIEILVQERNVIFDVVGLPPEVDSVEIEAFTIKILQMKNLIEIRQD